MRISALLLGVVLTSGSAFAAQVAVSSIGAARPAEAVPATITLGGDGPDRVWYGGMIEPVTVESGVSAAKTAGARRWLFDPPTVRGGERTGRTYRAIS
ncbi:MAG TPA: hypothetical protein VH158_09200 [Gemmatimonadales bacterium]|jgi:hypothetical protein|nr:hypothetical protein [Gemmatimonadales bacterium]